MINTRVKHVFLLVYTAAILADVNGFSQNTLGNEFEKALLSLFKGEVSVRSEDRRDCVAGSYGSMHKCEVCPNNQISPARATSIGQCHPCAFGCFPFRRGSLGELQCYACEVGSVTDPRDRSKSSCAPINRLNSANKEECIFWDNTFNAFGTSWFISNENFFREYGGISSCVEPKCDLSNWDQCDENVVWTTVFAWADEYIDTEDLEQKTYKTIWDSRYTWVALAGPDVTEPLQFYEEMAKTRFSETLQECRQDCNQIIYHEEPCMIPEKLAQEFIIVKEWSMGMRPMHPDRRVCAECDASESGCLFRKHQHWVSRSNDRILELTNTACDVGFNAACVENMHSWVGSIRSWMRNNPNGEPECHRIANLYPDGFSAGATHLAIQLPPSVNVEVFETNDCTGSATKAYYRLDYFELAKFYSGSLRFVVAPPHTVNNCPPHQGVKTNSLSFGGLFECVPCLESHRVYTTIQQTDAGCLFTVDVCRECQPNHYRSPTDDRFCAMCPLDRPYRDYEMPQCRACYDNETFVANRCVPMQRMQIVSVDGVLNIEPDMDVVRSERDNQFSPTRPVLEHHFLFIDVSVVSSDQEISLIKTETERPCHCARYMYTHLCGAAISTLQAYVLNANTNAVSLLDEANPEDLASLSIVREGVCKPCKACSVGEFNGDCLRQEGSCVQCKIISDCLANEYLHHEDIEGCSSFQATSDYSCRRCVQTREERGKYLLLAGCGQATFFMWHLVQVTDDSVTTTNIEKILCSYSEADEEWKYTDSNQQTQSCMYNGQAIQPHPLWGSHSTTLPYCPPGFYTNKVCADLTDTFDPACCVQCASCSGELKKSKHYKSCTGMDTYDTQTCSSRCDDGYYEAEGTCKQCTTCARGELY